jgi:bifunctional non-homologous end joining protein LigD
MTPRTPQPRTSRSTSLVSQLQRIERSGGDGTLHIARGRVLEVSSLDKVYFPDAGLTKGDVMRYYARVATWVLPVLRDRPLVLKRSPEGISGEVFFQQKPPATAAERARVQVVDTEAGPQERVIGGDIATVLYLVQLGCISMDPWHSRVRTLDDADYTIIDLDPGPDVSFRGVVQVAVAIKEVLDTLGLRAAAKTSGSRGIHIVVPLPPRTPFDVGERVAERVAVRVVEAHPRIATVERAVDERPAGTVYVDYLQNARGKSVAAAYSVRARPGGTVSMPLAWHEVTSTLDPRKFTIDAIPARLGARACPWREAMRRRNTTRAVRAAIE